MEHEIAYKDYEQVKGLQGQIACSEHAKYFDVNPDPDPLDPVFQTRIPAPGQINLLKTCQVNVNVNQYKKSLLIKS